MIHFKNSSGFTLIEVMLALVIAAIFISSIGIMQTRGLGAVVRYAHRYARIIHAKNFMLITRRAREESKDAKKFMLEKKEDNPESYFKYEFGSSEGSSLKNMKTIYVEKVSIKHESKQKEPSDLLLTLVYIPEAPE